MVLVDKSGTRCGVESFNDLISKRKLFVNVFIMFQISTSWLLKPNLRQFHGLQGQAFSFL